MFANPGFITPGIRISSIDAGVTRVPPQDFAFWAGAIINDSNSVSIGNY